MNRLPFAAALLGALAAIATLHADTPYDGHSVVRVQTSTPAELDQVLGLTDDVWSESIGVGELDLRVSPQQRALLQATGLRIDTLISDLGPLLAPQQLPQAPRAGPPFEAYADLPGLVAYMDSLAALRPDLASVSSIGTSIEGRPIHMIHVHAPGAPSNRPTVFYNGCHHAREWVTPAVPLYCADYLIRNYDTNMAIRALLSRVSFYLVPVVNPDGYAHTWTPNNRLWRKNRRLNANGTFGVDLNRNWGVGWGSNNGSSGTPSNETYRGTAAFSEPETAALRDFFVAHPEIIAYIDFHSYSQLTMWPWGYTSTPSAGQATYSPIGAALQNAIFNVFGTYHKIGPVYTTIYPVSGGSIDWTYGDRAVWSFAWEVRDLGQFGFLLPADQILPTCKENLGPQLLIADRFTAPVRFELVAELPFALEPGQPRDIDLSVLDGTQTVDGGTPTLHYRTDPSAPFTSVPLVNLTHSLYRGTIPAMPCGTNVEFYFSAAGVAGAANTDPLGAPEKTYSLPAVPMNTVLNDNFETDLGWTVSSTAPVAGAWTRVAPVGTMVGGSPAQPAADNPAGTGTLCFVTGQGATGGAADAADVDNGPTRLLSPVVDLSSGDARITYYRHFYCSNDSDAFDVDISNDAGTNWTRVESVRSTPLWLRRRINVADYVTPTATVRLRFSTQDPGNNSTTEAAIDDVVIERRAALVTPGDYNCTGAIEMADLAPFVETLLGIRMDVLSQQRADMNADTKPDGQDIQPFINQLLR